jgi:hypothetical protein
MDLEALLSALQTTQKKQSSARLSDRNVVELIVKLKQLGLFGDELLHTINGKEVRRIGCDPSSGLHLLLPTQAADNNRQAWFGGRRGWQHHFAGWMQPSRSPPPARPRRSTSPPTGSEPTCKPPCVRRGVAWSWWSCLPLWAWTWCTARSRCARPPAWPHARSALGPPPPARPPLAAS